MANALAVGLHYPDGLAPVEYIEDALSQAASAVSVRVDPLPALLLVSLLQERELTPRGQRQRFLLGAVEVSHQEIQWDLNDVVRGRVSLLIGRSRQLVDARPGVREEKGPMFGQVRLITVSSSSSSSCVKVSFSPICCFLSVPMTL